MGLNPPELQTTSLRQALALFEREFRQRHPDSQFLIDGEGYEDEDLDLNIFVDGDQLALEQEASELSLAVQQATGFFILPFVQPAASWANGGS